jgi:NADPH-dependent 2,4-dienoyl-CoA reductase/sulfur reductase-like enzyme
MRSRLRHDNETDREPISTYARYRRSAKSMPIPNAHRILVIGAGVGGISIARGLLRDGHDVTVFEQRPDMRPGGGAVTIWSNGSTVLEQLGVDIDWSPAGQYRRDRDGGPAGRTCPDGPTPSPA